MARNQSLSSVAAIVNKQGRWRVVVAKAGTFRHHLATGERLLRIPGLKTREPVPSADIAPLIAKVQKYVVRALAPTNHCGECQACCVISYVKEGSFEKASGARCPHQCEIGCGIYQYRPSVCRKFTCLWLDSQKRNDRMAAELRPDRCGAFFIGDTQTNDRLLFEVHGEPNADAMRWINEMQQLGYKAKKITHYIGESRK